MQSVGLTKVAVFSPFTSFLLEGGSPLERHLSSAGIDPLLLSNPNALIPLHWACDFVEKISHLEGIEDFGFKVGAMSSIGSMGPLGAILSNALTLKDLLDRLLRWVPHFDSGARIWTEPGSEPKSLKLCLRHDAENGRATADAYGLMILIDAVRMALGPSWKPRRFWIDQAAGTPQKFEALSAEHASSDVSYVAFEIPTDRLADPVSARLTSLNPEVDLQLTAPNNDLIGSLTQAIQSSMGSRLPVIEEAAALTRMSSRSLQRRLRENGLSYRNLVDRVRYKQATSLLGDPSLPVGDIARHLGYTNAANFNHAFRRWAGCSPSQYRQRSTRAA